jgi:hypothetical protein
VDLSPQTRRSNDGLVIRARQGKPGMAKWRYMLAPRNPQWADAFHKIVTAEKMHVGAEATPTYVAGNIYQYSVPRVCFGVS